MTPRRSPTRLALAFATLTLLAVAVGGCGGTQVSTVLSTIGSGPVIAANELTFDRSQLDVPAGEAFDLQLINNESAPHNVAIYADGSAAQPLFVGEIFGGPAARVYEVPALAAGTWFFRCDVHPDMKGSVVAAP
jgi:plastocyanin